MKKILASAAFAFACAAAPLPAVAAQSFEGDYGVDCGKSGYQCFWTFEKKGKGVYEAYFTAADGMDVTTKRCTDGATAKVSGKGLEMVMFHGGYRLTAKPDGDGGLVLKPTGGWKQDCAGFNMFGTLSPIGD